MMKKITYSLVLSLLFLWGCGDNPLKPYESLANKIKKGRPYQHININKNDVYVRKYDPEDFKNAYTEDGVFVVVSPSGDKDYYNLAEVESVEVRRTDYITLFY